MTSTKKDPVLVVLQLTGGNDYMNTVIPHAEPLYRDKRPVVGVPDERILKLNDSIGFHPELAPLRTLLGRRRHGYHSRRRLRQQPPQPLPQHGHLAHL